MNTFITNDQNEVIDVYQQLADNRVLFLTDDINDEVATNIVSTLLLKDLENSNDKITIFINSDGGDIRNIFMIYDMMRQIKSPIETVCIGTVTDEAIILLSSGNKGMRFATKNSFISVCQLMHDYSNHSNLTNAKKELDLCIRDNRRMMQTIANNTGKSLKDVNQDFNRRVFMSAHEAVKYGLIDKVIKFNK